jgi:hypothetical protein
MERPMTRAEQELRALRREMLLARAAAERASLADQLDALETRTNSGVAGLLIGGARRARESGWIRVAASAVRIARSQPWLVPAVVGGVARVARSRALRWVVLAGVVAAAVWWARSELRPAPLADAGEDSADTAPDSRVS